MEAKISEIYPFDQDVIMQVLESEQLQIFDNAIDPSIRSTRISYARCLELESQVGT